LRKKHLKPYKDESGKVLCLYLKIYDGEPNDEYWTLITNEAYEQIEKWFKLREKAGEVITDESPLMRKLWDMSKTDGAKAENIDDIILTDEGISSLMRRVVKATGIRDTFKENPKSSRHDTKLTHGFRKFHHSALKAVRSPEIRLDDILILTGHKGRVYTDNYLRDSKDPNNRIGDNLVKDYLRAEPILTIDPSKRNLSQMEEQISKRLENKYEAQYKESRKEILLMKFSKVVDNMIQKEKEKKNPSGIHLSPEEQLSYFTNNLPPRVTESDIELLKQMIEDKEITDYQEESEESEEETERFHKRYNEYLQHGRIDFNPLDIYSYGFDKQDNLNIEFKKHKKRKNLTLPPLK